MAQGYDVVCISSIDWDFIWQGHQEIMSTLARQGHRVLFIENTGVRTPNLRDLPRLRQRIRNWLRGTKGFRQERENLFIYSPLILPFPYARMAQWVNCTLLLRAFRRWMSTMGFRPSVLWTFLPTPLARGLIKELDPEVTIYYCIDDLASSSPSARRIRQSESRLFREADLVFVTSQRLRDRAAKFNERVHLFPFGVDFDTFSKTRSSADQVPEDLRTLPRPVVGYVGGIHRWVDQQLLERVVSGLREASFVFIGPRQTEVSQLARQPNVYFLGPRQHEDVPRYIKGFDVGIVPYHLSEYTAHVYPTKLNEYLAMGIPVVATDLPEIRRFNVEYENVVAVARDADGFIRCIKDGLDSLSPETVQQRIAIARQNSWQARIAQMSACIEDALLTRRAGEVSWEQRLRRLYRVTQRRFLRAVIGAAVVYLMLFRSPLIWWMAEPLEITEPVRPVEAIVVFAGGVGESGKAGGGYQERVKRAVDLYHAGLSPHLIFSSGYTFVFQEAEVMKELAVAHGVPASAIFLETKAINTFQNVAFVRQILDEHDWRTILLVSSPYHLRRAVLTFHKVAPDVTVISAPVLHSQFYAHSSGASLDQMRGILHEYLGILDYWRKGWI